MSSEEDNDDEALEEVYCEVCGSDQQRMVMMKCACYGPRHLVGCHTFCMAGDQWLKAGIDKKYYCHCCQDLRKKGDRAVQDYLDQKRNASLAGRGRPTEPNEEMPDLPPVTKSRIHTATQPQPTAQMRINAAAKAAAAAEAQHPIQSPRTATAAAAAATAATEEASVVKKGIKLPHFGLTNKTAAATGRASKLSPRQLHPASAAFAAGAAAATAAAVGSHSGKEGNARSRIPNINNRQPGRRTAADTFVSGINRNKAADVTAAASKARQQAEQQRRTEAAAAAAAAAAGGPVQHHPQQYQQQRTPSYQEDPPEYRAVIGQCQISCQMVAEGVKAQDDDDEKQELSIHGRLKRSPDIQKQAHANQIKSFQDELLPALEDTDGDNFKTLVGGVFDLDLHPSITRYNEDPEYSYKPVMFEPTQQARILIKEQLLALRRFLVVTLGNSLLVLLPTESGELLMLLPKDKDHMDDLVLEVVQSIMRDKEFGVTPEQAAAEQQQQQQGQQQQGQQQQQQQQLGESDEAECEEDKDRVMEEAQQQICDNQAAAAAAGGAAPATTRAWQQQQRQQQAPPADVEPRAMDLNQQWQADLHWQDMDHDQQWHEDPPDQHIAQDHDDHHTHQDHDDQQQQKIDEMMLEESGMDAQGSYYVASPPQAAAAAAAAAEAVNAPAVVEAIGLRGVQPLPVGMTEHYKQQQQQQQDFQVSAAAAASPPVAAAATSGAAAAVSAGRSISSKAATAQEAVQGSTVAQVLHSADAAAAAAGCSVKQLLCGKRIMPQIQDLAAIHQLRVYMVGFPEEQLQPGSALFKLITAAANLGVSINCQRDAVQHLCKDLNIIPAAAGSNSFATACNSYQSSPHSGQAAAADMVDLTDNDDELPALVCKHILLLPYHAAAAVQDLLGDIPLWRILTAPVIMLTEGSGRGLLQYLYCLQKQQEQQQQQQMGAAAKTPQQQERSGPSAAGTPYQSPPEEGEIIDRIRAVASPQITCHVTDPMPVQIPPDLAHYQLYDRGVAVVVDSATLKSCSIQQIQQLLLLLQQCQQQQQRWRQQQQPSVLAAMPFSWQLVVGKDDFDTISDDLGRWLLLEPEVATGRVQLLEDILAPGTLADDSDSPPALVANALTLAQQQQHSLRLVVVAVPDIDCDSKQQQQQQQQTPAGGSSRDVRGVSTTPSPLAAARVGSTPLAAAAAAEGDASSTPPDRRRIDPIFRREGTRNLKSGSAEGRILAGTMRQVLTLLGRIAAVNSSANAAVAAGSS